MRDFEKTAACLAIEIVHHDANERTEDTAGDHVRKEVDPEVDSGVHRGQYDECHDDSIAPVSHQQDREGTKGSKIGTVTGDEAIKSPS